MNGYVSGSDGNHCFYHGHLHTFVGFCLEGTQLEQLCHANLKTMLFVLYLDASGWAEYGACVKIKKCA